MGQGFQGDGVLGYYYLKLIGLGVCIGILSAVLRTIFHIDDAVFWHWYWTVGVIFVLGAALVYILYVQRYAKRMREAIACYEKGEIQTYMDKLEAMLDTAKGRNLRNTLKIDLSVGHYAKKEYESAIRILEDMSEEPMRSGLRLVYQLNLCLFYFRTNRNAQAMEIYRTGGKDFARYRKNNYYGGNIALLDMLAAMHEGRYGEAEDLLAHARQTWKFPRLQKEYWLIEEYFQPFFVYYIFLGAEMREQNEDG